MHTSSNRKHLGKRRKSAVVERLQQHHSTFRARLHSGLHVRVDRKQINRQARRRNETRSIITSRCQCDAVSREFYGCLLRDGQVVILFSYSTRRRVHKHGWNFPFFMYISLSLSLPFVVSVHVSILLSIFHFSLHCWMGQYGSVRLEGGLAESLLHIR